MAELHSFIFLKAKRLWGGQMLLLGFGFVLWRMKHGLRNISVCRCKCFFSNRNSQGACKSSERQSFLETNFLSSSRRCNILREFFPFVAQYLLPEGTIPFSSEIDYVLLLFVQFWVFQFLLRYFGSIWDR